MKRKRMRWVVYAWVLALALTGCSKEHAPETHAPAETTTTVTATTTTVTALTEATTEETTTTAEKTSETTVTSITCVSASTTKATTVTVKETATTNRPTKAVITTTTEKVTTNAPITTSIQITTTTTTTTSTSFTTSAVPTRPTALSSTGHAIAVNKDDPWKYPLDVNACIADCKAYGESLGLTWDESLALDNASWSGEICTYQTAIDPERWDDRAEVFLDIDRIVREGNRRFCILFIPCHQTGAYGTIDGIYNIYVVSL